MCRWPASQGNATPTLGSFLHFDLEVESGSEQYNEWQRLRLASQLNLLHNEVASLLRPQSMFHTRLLRDVKLIKRDLVLEEGELDPVVLATQLTLIGYKVHIRSALGGNARTTDCFYNLRNEFLLVAGEDEAAGMNFIVESRFKEHFAIPHPTDRYKGLLDRVPSELVAPPEALSPLVTLLCSEMQLAFEERGLSLPPWRVSKSLLSKWLPTKAKDYDMSPVSGSPRAASPTEAPSALILTALSSGSLTPAHHLEEDSPRAVLYGAAAVLSGNDSARPTKQRSLLSADLAASGCTSPKALGTAGSTAESVSGWATPPIRRVRMAGVPRLAA